MMSSITACNPEFVDQAAHVSKAFLQGMAFEELSKEAGEELRKVAFTLPMWAVRILKQIDG